MITTRTRLAVVLTTFAAMIWISPFTVDRSGTIAFMLLASLGFLLVQITWLRGVFTTRAVFFWSFVVPTAFGFAVILPLWRFSDEQIPTVITGGVVLGVVGGFTTLWLGNLAQIRRHPKIFISYRRDDSQQATSYLYESLVKRYGRDSVFMDTQSLQPGLRWRDQLQEVISRCDIVIVVIGPVWCELREAAGGRRLDRTDDPVRVEIEMALAMAKPTMPVLIGGADLPRAEQLPESIRLLPEMHGAVLRERFLAEDTLTLITMLDNTQRTGARESILPAPVVRRGRKLRVVLAVVAYLFVMAAPASWAFLTDGGSDLDAAAVSPDGSRIAALDDNVLRIWSSTTGELQQARPLGGSRPSDMLEWSPDGRRIATASTFETSITIWDVAGLTKVTSLLDQQDFAFESGPAQPRLAWSPDSTRVAAGDGAGNIRVWEATNAKPIASAQLAKSGVSALAWSPQGPDRIAYGSDDSAIRVLAVGAELTPIYTFTHYPPPVTVAPSPNPTVLVLPSPVPTPPEVDYVAWSGDGTRLLTQAGSDIRLHRLSGGAPGPLLKVDAGSSFRDISWSPQGTWLALRVDYPVTQILLRNVETGATRTAPFGSWDYSSGTVLAWSVDGAELAVVDRFSIRLWSAALESETESFNHGQEGSGLSLIGWLSGKRRVATIRSESVDLWDIDKQSRQSSLFVTHGELLRE
ncbi:WD40 repeat protein [Allocatelliglobosispora scoriae]|uniref:WD40 repeat protein n=1 Tax=Allocatelliglobosispora scoriae TaxID=643052 RepID=A0A841BQ32_9ACTN|nr:toll/interleukin-1 receptor domain-containing protein [Allocatelliglobosispora scoriae]MBB5869053.1 WD40 repeat protein [Allocatelliglobosispora scoriae]